MIRHLLVLLTTVLAVGACPPREAERPDAQSTPTASSGQKAIEEGPAPKGEEPCVDQWLKQKGLDEYGNPAGTMYTGGTPLFDEQTGKSVDRLEYIYRNHPEAKTACQSK